MKVNYQSESTAAIVRGLSRLFLSRLRLLPLLWLLSLLAACQGLPVAIDADAQAQWSNLIEAEDYRQAQRMLAAIPSDHPQSRTLQARGRQLPALIAGFEKRQLKRSRKLSKGQQWLGALALVERALKQLPDSDALAKEYGRVQRARDTHVLALMNELSLIEAEGLLSQAPLLEKLQRAGVASDRGWQQWQYESKSAALADKLLVCGKGAIEQQDWRLANRCLSRAQALQPSETLAAAQRRLTELSAQSKRQQRLASQRAKARQRDSKSRQQRIDVARLRGEFHQQLAVSDWRAAAKRLAELQQLALQPAVFNGLQADLDRQLQHYVDRAIRLGQSLYSRGELQQALTTWQAAAQVAGDNVVLLGHIARAEKFIDKLARLEKGVKPEAR